MTSVTHTHIFSRLSLPATEEKECKEKREQSRGKLGKGGEGGSCELVRWEQNRGSRLMAGSVLRATRLREAAKIKACESALVPDGTGGRLKFGRNVTDCR